MNIILSSGFELKLPMNRLLVDSGINGIRDPRIEV